MKPRSTRAQGDGLPSHEKKRDNCWHPNNFSPVTPTNTASRQPVASATLATGWRGALSAHARGHNKSQRWI